MLRLSAFATMTLLLAGSVLPPGPAFADAAKGRALVERSCASCHATGPAGASRHKDAPPFREVARKYDPDDLGEAFAEGIVVGHKDMPEFRLTAPEIGDLIDYFKQLARR